MPELPEVETIRRDLEAYIVGRAITGIDIRWPRTIDRPDPLAFAAQLTNRRIMGTGRRGKYLILHLDHDADLIIHLRMTGQLLLCSALPAEQRHIHVVFTLDDGSTLMYRDVRKFGRMYLVDDANKVVGDLGPEPLSDAFTKEEFAQRLARRKGMIKPLLLNQRFVAGLGNIYVDEALFAARIHPERQVNTLTVHDVANLHQAIRDVLAQGIRNRGTTLDDFCDLDGQQGQNQSSLSVFQRAEEPCPRCGTQIQRIVVGGRGTFFCSTCQSEHADIQDVSRQAWAICAERGGSE